MLLVDKGKLPRIRKRIGLPKTISQLSRNKWDRNFFNSAKTFAVTWESGTPQEVKNKCRNIVKDELALLTLSDLGYNKRRLGSYPTFKGDSNVQKIEEFIHGTKDNRGTFSGTLTGKMDELRLNDLWLDFQQQGYFIKLLKILNDKIRVSRNWRNDLERASILVGQSMRSTDLAQSFLWNVIALESIFKEQNEKFSTEFPKRAEAFLGWIGFWNSKNYTEKINNMYRKRCEFVHEGKRNQITVEDLLFTDDLIFNLLLNIIQHIEIFPTKKSVIDFSKKVEAEHILNVKPRVRPKTLQYFSRKYTDKDLQEI